MRSNYASWNKTRACNMNRHVFTYGSLMFADVWQRVVRGSYRSAPASMPGHARFAVKGETYPGMVPAAGATVRGVMYFDVAPRDIAALDAFEGADYRRADLQAVLDSGEAITASAYIYRDVQRLEHTGWRPEAFQMQRFLDTYCHNRLAE